MTDNIIRPTFGPKATKKDDFQFFHAYPERRYHARPSTVEDFMTPGDPDPIIAPGDITIMQKVVDLDSDCGFSIQHHSFAVQGKVLDTDEDIANLLQEMRRQAVGPKDPEPWRRKGWSARA